MNQSERCSPAGLKCVCILRSCNAAFHGAPHFLPVDVPPTHTCVLHRNVGWPPLTIQHEQCWFLFLLARSLQWMSSFPGNQNPLLSEPEKPRITAEAGNWAFSYYVLITGVNSEALINWAKLFQSRPLEGRVCPQPVRNTSVHLAELRIRLATG